MFLFSKSYFVDKWRFFTYFCAKRTAARAELSHLTLGLNANDVLSCMSMPRQDDLKLLFSICANVIHGMNATQFLSHSSSAFCSFSSTCTYGKNFPAGNFAPNRRDWGLPGILSIQQPTARRILSSPSHWQKLAPPCQHHIKPTRFSAYAL